MKKLKSRWQSLNRLCWEGFDKVLEYASNKYPNKSTNKSLELFMKNYEGDWESKIDLITK